MIKYLKLKANFPTTWFGISIVFFITISFLSPTIQLLVTHGFPPNSVFDYLIILLPDFGFASVLISHLIFNKIKSFKFKLIDYAISGFLFINIVWGGFLSDDLIDALKSIRLTYLPLTFYFVARSWKPNELELKSTINTVFSVYLILAIFGWIIWLFFPSLTNLFYYYSGHPVASYFIVRMTSLLWTPVLFGTLMAWTAYFYYWKFIKSESFNFSAALFLIITFSALVMSVSRGALLAFYIVLLLLLPFTIKWKKTLAVFIGLLIVQGLISLSINGKLEMQNWVFSSTTSAIKLENKETRVSRWAESYEDFKAKPEGYGLGNAGAVSFNSEEQNNEASLSTDGWFLKLACETGWTGLISFASLALICFLELWRNRFNNINKMEFSSLGFVLIVFFQCFASNVLDFYPYIGIFWFILGLSIEDKHTYRL
jgi:O-antigen ligase